MQKSFSRMLQSVSQEYAEKGMGPTVRPEEMEQGGSFRLEKTPERDFTRYFIMARSPNGRTGWRFNDYEERKQEREAKRHQISGGDGRYTPVKWEISQ